MLRNKIADIITNELFERFGSPSSAVIGVQLADRMIERYFDQRTGQSRLLNWVEVKRPRDSDGTATAALCEDIAVPQDCQARAEGIAKKGSHD